jgi:hypothetical protein
MEHASKGRERNGPANRPIHNQCCSTGAGPAAGTLYDTSRSATSIDSHCLETQKGFLTQRPLRSLMATIHQGCPGKGLRFC